MQLDITTLAVAGSVVSGCIFISMLIVSQNKKKYPGFIDWTMGALSLCIGFWIFSLRELIPDFFSIVIANGLIYFYTISIINGLSRFSNIKPKYWLNGVLIFIFFSLFLYFTYFRPDVNVRIVIISFLFLINSLRGLIIVYRNIPKVIFHKQTSLIIIFSIDIVWNLIRIILTLSIEEEITDFMQAGIIQASSFLIIYFTSIISSILFLKWNLERLQNELNKSQEKVKTLTGFIPICSVCKKIRKNDIEWEALEEYISENSDAQFTHSICPDCLKKVYGIEKLEKTAQNQRD